jgi:thioredoxin-related protein
MKTKVLVLALCCFSVFFISLLLSRRTADATKEKPPGIYDQSLDGKKQIADAVVVANREHKRILLQFGANWCSWCIKLHHLFETDKSVSQELKTGYVLALIDVNEGHNQDLVVKYGAETGYGLPFLVVLDSNGKHLITRQSDDLEEGDHHSPQKVLAFLKAPLMTNAPPLRGPVEISNPVRDEATSRQIAMTLLEMHHQWATNNYRAAGMTVPKFLAEQGAVSGHASGTLGTFVEYDFQRNGNEWTRRFHILRADTNTTTWVLYEMAAPKDTNLLKMAWQHELTKVTKEP